MTVDEKRTTCHSRTGTFPTESSRSTLRRSTASISPLAEFTYRPISKRSLSTDVNFRISRPQHVKRNFLYTTLYVQTERVLRVRMCCRFTDVTYGPRILLVLSANMDIKPTSASAFGMVSSGALPCYPTS